MKNFLVWFSFVILFGQSKLNYRFVFRLQRKKKRLVYKISFYSRFARRTSVWAGRNYFATSKIPSKSLPKPSPAKGGARQQSPKIRILKIGGAFWLKSELFLTKIRTANFERYVPPPLANARHPAKKFSLLFLICARSFFSSKRKRKLFCWVASVSERRGGASKFTVRIFIKKSSDFNQKAPPIFRI